MNQGVTAERVAKSGLEPGFLTPESVLLTCRRNNPGINGNANLDIRCTWINESTKDKNINLFKKSVGVDMAVWEQLGCSRHGWFPPISHPAFLSPCKPRICRPPQKKPHADWAVHFKFLKSSLAEISLLSVLSEDGKHVDRNLSNLFYMWTSLMSLLSLLVNLPSWYTVPHPFQYLHRSLSGLPWGFKASYGSIFNPKKKFVLTYLINHKYVFLLNVYAVFPIFKGLPYTLSCLIPKCLSPFNRRESGALGSEVICQKSHKVDKKRGCMVFDARPPKKIRKFF